ncbi:C-type mannose receptor 2 [Merluccius polli]|uniref:C-type mannose receptor 2 n=1 Tax=Merluccius polli TaxID=89951 RepID=A0AA47MNC9_MERPO|nr:C-type mannose receptor 2 [Merluccius polli]
MTWQDAQSYCRERHSDLATISNSRDNNIALKSKTNSAENNVWIGLNNNNTQGAWRWSEPEDSSNASFYNWNKDEPNGNSDCVEMREDGRWNDKKCTTKLPFICHGMGYRNYHYIDKKMTWQDAQSYCRERHYDLATISNMRDNNIAFKSQTNSAENDVWIGLNKNQGAWRWSDSSNASFYNWKEREPSGDGNCVQMKWEDGRWNDVYCHYKQPFICHEPTIYHYIDDKVTWQDAQSYCRKHHYDLATISNMRDNNIAFKSQTNSAENDVWIGLNKNQGAWRWSDSSIASFYNWNKDELNGDGKSLHNDCVEMTKDGSWNSMNCNYEQPFVCLRSL